MQPLTRHLGFTLILLLVFLTAALAAQAWLQRESRRLQADVVAAKRAQFAKALESIHQPPETWDADFRRLLGDLMGGTMTLYSDALPPPLESPGAGLLGFDYRLPGDHAFTARVTFAAPAANRLAVLHERMLVAIILLALLLLMVSALLTLPRRSLGESGTHQPWTTARAEMAGMEHFARISVARGEALERESGARHRAEEDLQLSRTLLGQSLEERIQLGRELHDSICQTLYAVSLTLEGMRARLAGSPGDTTQRLDQCITELRRLNHEVRSFLKELEPGTVHRQPFIEALDSMLGSQPCDAGVRLVRNLDEDATALIAPERATEVVNILREAVSNSLQHGRARTITVHARRDEGTVLLAVQDDGAGFDPAAHAAHGHGLANMQARAAVLGGTVNVVSSAGKGTRVLLTLPVTSAP
jgi:signal transduction histidine kinase